MAAMTITEALQEIKTIGKRLEKKRLGVLGYVARDSRLKDPLEKDGGSEKFVATERQSIKDLERRIVAIRGAIQKKNSETMLELAGNNMSVTDWLNWRRDVAEGQQRFQNQLASKVAEIKARYQAQQPRNVGLAVAQVGQEQAPVEVVVSFDEKQLLTEIEGHEQILGDLDGKLSLLNATTTIDV